MVGITARARTLCALVVETEAQRKTTAQNVLRNFFIRNVWGEGIVQQRGFRSPTFKEFPRKAVAALFALSVWERIGEGLVRDYKSFPQSPPQKRGEEKGARQTKRAEQ